MALLLLSGSIVPKRHINYYIKYVLLVEEFPDLSLHLLSRVLVGHLVFADEGLEVDLVGNEVPGGEEVVVVDVLDKWLALGPPLDLLLRHSLGHLQGVPLNASHQSVSELLVLRKAMILKTRHTFFPSSCCLTTMAFFPACLPASKMTTRPGFIL